MVTLVYLVYIISLVLTCISQHLCHFILEACFFFLFILTVFNIYIVLI